MARWKVATLRVACCKHPMKILQDLQVGGVRRIAGMNNDTV